uniref:EOG090X08YX n=1 Tax=Alona affinis TaxID=381656 RepID=A0A9N6WP24_9CRUS|nr:EOG090X08YX [Alona affinis]
MMPIIPTLPPKIGSPAAKPVGSVETSIPRKSSDVKPGKKVLSSPIGDQEYMDLDLSNMRRTIAKRLTQSKSEIPHAYNTVSCNMDSVLKLRKKMKIEGIDFSINDVIIKAVATALSLCPEVNVVWKGDELVQPNSIDVSVAVATTSGLITPIVTDVPLRGLQDIGKTVRDLAERARIGKLQLHEFQGGSFTRQPPDNEYNDLCLLDSFTTVAITESTLFQIGEDGKPTMLMTATLSYDGGAISAVAAATFMTTLRNLLESPQNLILGQSVNQQVHQRDEAVVNL